MMREEEEKSGMGMKLPMLESKLPMASGKAPLFFRVCFKFYLYLKYLSFVFFFSFFRFFVSFFFVSLTRSDVVSFNFAWDFGLCISDSPYHQN